MQTWAMSEYALYVGRPLLEVLQSLQFAADEASARALVESGAVQLDGRQLLDAALVLKIRDLRPGSILQAGTQQATLIIWRDAD